MAEFRDVFASTTAASVPLGVSYQHENLIRPAIVEYTTAAYLSVLGLQPSLGRWFEAAEEARGAGVVAVLGHLTWTRKFHADPSVIGRTIRIEGVPVTIVGVGPAGHNATINIGVVTDFWMPITSVVTLGAPPRTLERRPEEAGFLVKARLRDGVTVAQAQAAMRILGARLATEYPNEDPGKGITVFASSDVRVHPQLDGVLRWLATVLLGVVGLVLAIACSNLATLLLVRGAARAREVAVRLALGATRGQLIRHLLTESILLSVAGGAAGCLMAWWGIRLLNVVELPIVVNLGRRLPGVDVRDRVVTLHWRGLRPRAGAESHAHRSGGWPARRRRDAIGGPSLVHGQERARGIPGRGVRAAAWRRQPLPPDAQRLADAARRLRGRRRGHARVRYALRGYSAAKPPARTRSFAAGSRRFPVCSPPC